jgi:hypothetical protein
MKVDDGHRRYCARPVAGAQFAEYPAENTARKAVDLPADREVTKMGIASRNCGTGLVKPATTPELLRLLHVDHEPVTRQWSAITDWLTDHTPTIPLRCSLLANGYGYLLRQAAHEQRQIDRI